MTVQVVVHIKICRYAEVQIVQNRKLVLYSHLDAQPTGVLSQTLDCSVVFLF